MPGTEKKAINVLAFDGSFTCLKKARLDQCAISAAKKKKYIKK